MRTDEQARKTLLDAAAHIGGYRSIGIIAREAIRRLEAAAPKHRKDAGARLVEAFSDLVAAHGDVHAAIYLRKAVGEYQKQLGGVGMGERANLWERVCRALDGLIRDARR